MSKRSGMALGVAMVLALTAGSATAQVQGAQAAPSPEVQSWVMEIQELQARLGPIQEQAMQDPALRDEQEAISTMVQSAMAEDPELTDLPQRAADLQARAQAAVQADDTAQLEAIMTEAHQLEQRVALAQTAVLERPEIAARAEAFQTRLQGRMVEVDPEAEVMLQRFVELQNRLVEAMSRGS